MKTNSGYGGSQRDMHPTNTNQEVGYLGPNEKKFDVGDWQYMILQEGSDVPFWINPQECISTKFSQYNDP